MLLVAHCHVKGVLDFLFWGGERLAKVNDTSRHVKKVTLIKGPAPVLLQFVLCDQRRWEVLAWLNIEKHIIGWRLVQVPLLFALKLEQEGVDVVVVWSEALFHLCLDWVWGDVNIDTSFVLE